MALADRMMMTRDTTDNRRLTLCTKLLFNTVHSTQIY